MTPRVAQTALPSQPAVNVRRRPKLGDIKSLRHGIEALRLAAALQTISSGVLARTCAISRASAFRILQTLEEERYLVRTGCGNQVRYHPSQRVRRLADGYEGSIPVLDVAMPMMIESSRQSGWPLALSTPDGGFSILRFTTDPAASRALARYRPGAHMCAPMSAAALLSLAYQPETIQQEALRTLPDMPLPDYAPRRTAAELSAMLERARQDGYAVFRPLGLREANLSMPIFVDEVLTACLTMRYMLVADQGKTGHSERVKALRELCDRIAVMASRAASGRAEGPPGARRPPPMKKARIAAGLNGGGGGNRTHVRKS